MVRGDGSVVLGDTRHMVMRFDGYGGGFDEEGEGEDERCMRGARCMVVALVGCHNKLHGLEDWMAIWAVAVAHGTCVRGLRVIL